MRECCDVYICGHPITDLRAPPSPLSVRHLYNDHHQEQGLPYVCPHLLVYAYDSHDPANSVHDGWGISEETKGNAVHAGTTTSMDTLAKENAYRTLLAHGTAVGLSQGLMGNSEVG